MKVEWYEPDTEPLVVYDDLAVGEVFVCRSQGNEQVFVKVDSSHAIKFNANGRFYVPKDPQVFEGKVFSRVRIKSIVFELERT